MPLSLSKGDRPAGEDERRRTAPNRTFCQGEAANDERARQRRHAQTMTPHFMNLSVQFLSARLSPSWCVFVQRYLDIIACLSSRCLTASRSYLATLPFIRDDPRHPGCCPPLTQRPFINGANLINARRQNGRSDFNLYLVRWPVSLSSSPPQAPVVVLVGKPSCYLTNMALCASCFQFS